MVIIIIIGCISHFFIFRFFIHYSTDEILNEYKTRIENYVSLHDTLNLATEIVLQPARIEQQKIDDISLYPAEMYKDTLLYSELTGSFAPYRQLYFPVAYKNSSYLININQPTMESDDLLYAIVASLLVLFVLFIVFVYAISYSLKKSIAGPLTRNLQRLRNYDLRANTKLELENPNIQEFDELNNVIMRMVRKINEDYENSRIFTEDASHEMQTPLSVIKSKVDLLMQKDSLNQEEQANNLIAISRAVTRLSRLNKSLLLITKINNDQFQEKENVDLSRLINAYLFDMEELIGIKGIVLNTDIEDCICYMNPVLAEIMISNLLSNAIRHNIKNGKIDVCLNSRQLSVSNTCLEADVSVNLFTRLVKQNNTEDSSGLGLNIVKSICEKNGFDVKYYYPERDIFRIEVLFTKGRN
ncbi:MAG: sensor histidine kinase [Dysgonomonas sp.]